MSGDQDVPMYLNGSKNGAMDKMVGFRLYIKGMNPNSVKALITTKAICERYPSGKSYLEIVDSLREPYRASEDGITIIPTLVKLWPLPSKSVSKEIDDPEQVLNILEITI